MSQRKKSKKDYKTLTAIPCIRRGDIIIIAGCILIAVVMLLSDIVFARESGEYGFCAEIYQAGELIETVDLDTDRDIVIENVVISISGGTIAFTDSDCPDRICVRTGELKKPGDMAVCVPNKISVIVKSRSGHTGDGGIDAITY